MSRSRGEGEENLKVHVVYEELPEPPLARAASVLVALYRGHEGQHSTVTGKKLATRGIGVPRPEGASFLTIHWCALTSSSSSPLREAHKSDHACEIWCGEVGVSTVHAWHLGLLLWM